MKHFLLNFQGMPSAVLQEDADGPSSLHPLRTSRRWRELPGLPAAALYRDAARDDHVQHCT